MQDERRTLTQKGNVKQKTIKVEEESYKRRTNVHNKKEKKKNRGQARHEEE